MAYKKTRTTVWPDGRVISSTSLGECEDDALHEDMATERESHAFFPSTQAVEEMATTLVIIKETGTTHVYNWIKF